MAAGACPTDGMRTGLSPPYGLARTVWSPGSNPQPRRSSVAGGRLSAHRQRHTPRGRPRRPPGQGDEGQPGASTLPWRPSWPMTGPLPWPASPGTASTSERATTPGQGSPRGRSPDRARVAPSGPVSGADGPPGSARVGAHSTIDVPRNAHDASGVTARIQTPRPRSQRGRAARVFALWPCAAQCAAPEGTLTSRQALRRRAAPGLAGRGWRPAGRPHSSHGRYRSRA
jgi:hypothetical protein